LGWGSPRPIWGAYNSAPPDPLAAFKGPYFYGKGEGEGEKKGRKKEFAPPNLHHRSTPPVPTAGYP